jgi:hypothetical protein
VSSHYPLLHPPTNSFWYRIGTTTIYDPRQKSAKVGDSGLW